MYSGVGLLLYIPTHIVCYEVKASILSTNSLRYFYVVAEIIADVC